LRQVRDEHGGGAHTLSLHAAAREALLARGLIEIRELAPDVRRVYLTDLGRALLDHKAVTR
jgi:hypothetical protein